MSMVILNHVGVIQNISKYRDNEKSIFTDARANALVSIKYDNYMNSNGGSFRDIVSCPTAIVMSGATVSAVVGSTIAYQSGSIVCNGTYSTLIWQIFNIFCNFFDSYCT